MPSSWIAFVLVAVMVVCGGPVSSVARAQATAAPELFERGRAAYREGRFDEAAELFAAAYEEAHAPNLLYNLARALENAGRADAAIDAYRRYLIADPGAEDRAGIEERIARLVAGVEERRALEEDRRAEEARRIAEEARRRELELALEERRRPDVPAGPSAVPWIFAGVGVAGLVASGIVGGLSLERHDAVRSAPSQEAAHAVERESLDLATGANLGFLIGGVVTLAFATWGIVDVATTGGGPRASARIEPSGLGLRVLF